MATIAEQLKEAREKQAEQRTIVAGLLKKAETRDWNEEADGPALTAAQAALEALAPQIQTLESRASLAGQAANWTSDATTSAPITVSVINSENRGDDQEKARKNFRLMDAARDVMRVGRPTGLAAELDQEGKNEVRTSKLDGSGGGHLTLPTWMFDSEVRSAATRPERRDITATTTTTGGYTVDTTLGALIPFLDPRLAVRQMGATYLPGQTSNLDFPRNDAAATAVWASTENATSTETTPTFDKISLSPKRITTFTDVSQQNLVQTSIAMENFVRGRLMNARDNLLETACISGTGSSGQPTGLLTVSGTNDITIGTNGGPLTWALVVQFETETATDNADMGSLGYLFTPGVAGVLKTTKRDVAGNGFIWEGPNQNALVNGYRAMATNFLPSNLTKGSSSGVCHAAIFGNWAELIIAQWGGVDLLFNPYTKGKEALVEIIMHNWFDLAVRHNVSFCKCDEITLS